MILSISVVLKAKLYNLPNDRAEGLISNSAFMQKKSVPMETKSEGLCPQRLFFFFCLSFNSMVDKKEQQSETPPDGSPPSLRQDDQSKRSDREQQSSNEVHPLHPSTPTRAQQQRHRRNLRLNGQVDVEEGSTARYSLSNERRDSWIDRINSSTKKGKKRPKKKKDHSGLIY
jgi:hypothetical protein